MAKIKTQQIILTDKILLEVGNIDDAIGFYKSIGFILNFRIPQLRGASFYMAPGEPRLILKQTDQPKPSCLRVEVGNVKNVQKYCDWLNINGELLEAATGFIFQINDPWNNKIGFVDYTKKPRLARLTD